MGVLIPLQPELKDSALTMSVKTQSKDSTEGIFSVNLFHRIF